MRNLAAWSAAAFAGCVAFGSIDGIYPQLAMSNDEGECGTGAVVPWAGSLWVVTYGPHAPTGSSDKLYQIKPDLTRVVRAESVGGTPANRMIHRESNQLFIGPYAIDAQGGVRVISPKRMPGRLTATGRHTSDPANKVYTATMDNGLYEIDVKTLAVKTLVRDDNGVDGAIWGRKAMAGFPYPSDWQEAIPNALPGSHTKGMATGFGKVFLANNGEYAPEARTNPWLPSGVLGLYDPLVRQQRVIRRCQFTDVTTADGIYGNEHPETNPIWSLGWDAKSVILAVTTNGVAWTYYRLPKASHSYDGAHGWNTEWPRIREAGLGHGDLLATMHGTFWRFPKGFSPATPDGIRPISTYLKVIGDFAYWQDAPGGGAIVFGCDDHARNQFLGTRKLKKDQKPNIRSTSNLWFVKPEELKSLGPPSGEGWVWRGENLKAGALSDPYLWAGYEDRDFAFTDANGEPVPHLLLHDGDWVRVKALVDVKGANAHFVYGPKRPEKLPVLDAKRPYLDVTDDNGAVWRFPNVNGDTSVICREVVTERDLLYAGGVIYEVPAENAGGFAVLRPIALADEPVKTLEVDRGLIVVNGRRMAIDSLWKNGTAGTAYWLWRRRDIVVDVGVREDGDGSAERPVKSLLSALRAAREMPRTGSRPVTIKLRKGDYVVPEGIVLEAADSHLRLVGEKGVRLTRAEKATPGGIVKCVAARAPDVESYFKMAPHAPMFFYDGKWATEARWPNRGWAMFKKDQVVESGRRGRCIAGIRPDNPTAAGSFRFDSDRPATWDWQHDDIRLCGYTTHDWSFERLRLASYTPSNRLVRLAGPTPYGLCGESWSEHAGRRFYITGPKAELDAPGEYCYDRKSGRVDFIAPKGMRDFFAVTREGPLVSVRGASDVAFEGIVFEYAAGDGFLIEESTNVVVRDSFVWNVGGNGAVISGGRDCRIERTEIAECGFAGVRVSGGDRRTLVRSDHVVADCDIHGFSRICRTYAPAVHALGVGVTVRGCKIHDAPHAGVLYGGNDHLFENNEVCGILWESGDAGAFYTGRDPTSRGNVLRGNYVHDIGHPENGSRNTMAFYLDDCDAGDTIVSNRIVNVPRGIMLGGGHDNHLTGNVFERCNLAISVDARGVVWDDHWDSPTDRSWQMTRKVKEMHVDEEPWKSRYPLLATYLSDGPREPRHCSIVGNRFIGCREIWEWGMRANEFKHLVEMRDNVERPLSDTVAKLPAKPTLPKDELRVRQLPVQKAGHGASLKAAAEKALADKPTPFPDDLYLEFWTTGDRNRFQRWKSTLCMNTAILTAAEAEEGKGRYLRGIEERLNAICDMKSWVHPAHDWSDGGKGSYHGTRLTVDLGCSDIGALLACVVQTLDGRLDSSVRERVVQEVWRRIIKPLWREIPYHACQGGNPGLYDHLDHWWISAENNWNAVCWDNVLCAALGLVDDVRIRAYFVDAALKSVPAYLASFGDDGYCPEGMGYWNYGFGHHLQMGLMLRKVSGGRIDVFASPKQRRIAQYAYGYRLSEQLSPSFADGVGAPEPQNLARVDEIWPDLAKGLPSETTFASNQVWLWRDPQGVSVAFKGGHNDELHNHNDVGTYWVMLGDKAVGGDPGSEVYTRRTFSGDRYQSKILNSFGHPVPVVGGRLQSTGRRFAAKVVSSSPEVVILELAGAYDVKALKRLTRTFAYDRKSKKLTIRDRVEFSEPTAFESPYLTYRMEDNAEISKAMDPWVDYGDLVFPKGWNVRPGVEAHGGAWHLEEETIANPQRWSPRRVAVKFDRPIREGEVLFTYPGGERR